MDTRRWFADRSIRQKPVLVYLFLSEQVEKALTIRGLK